MSQVDSGIQVSIVLTKLNIQSQSELKKVPFKMADCGCGREPGYIGGEKLTLIVGLVMKRCMSKTQL